MAKIKNNPVNFVYETTNYSEFKFRKDNRDIIPKHVKDLMVKMKEHGWLAGSYVVVNGKGEIIDGQHRVKAAIETKTPIRYIVEENTGKDELLALNRDQKNWTLKDYIDIHIKHGNENYVILRNFMYNFSDFNPSDCISLLLNNSGSINRSTFENGGFKVKDVNKATEWALKIRSLSPYFDGYNKNGFIRAILRLFVSKPHVFDFDEFLHKLQLRPRALVVCGNTHQYIALIEEIYNFHRKNNEKVNLRY